MNKNKVKKLLWITGAFFALVLIAYFSLRGFFLHRAFQNAQQRLKASGLNMEADAVGFASFSGVYFKNLMICPDQQDTLFTADSMYVQLRLLPLLQKNTQVKDLAVFDAELTLIHKASADNFMFLFDKEADSLQSELDEALADTIQPGDRTRNFGKIANDFVDSFFDNTPEGTRLKNVRARWLTDSTRLDFFIEKFDFSDNHYHAAVHVREDTLASQYLSAGEIRPRENKFDFLFYGTDHQKIYLPFVGPLLNARMGFDSVRLNLQGKEYGSGVLTLVGETTFSGVMVRQEKISENNVRVNHASMTFDVNIGPSYAEIDSGSRITVNAIGLKPYVKFSQTDSRELAVSVKSTFKAQDFFNSLPEGLFSTLQGIKARGNLPYKMQFKVDFSNPDNLSFSSSMDGHDFALEAFGDVNFKKINGPFLHKVYVDDRFIQSFVVGPGNPDYTPLVHVSPYLVYAVMNNEDGSFYTHEGFNERAFRESIALNIKEGAFVRGASTIPMQLVKNVFLSRDKTITRKLEEIIIVWLIENLDLVSKRRMLEVYFNIIEFGPNIYGVSNGTHFYFNKAPSQLTLAEALFMSSIVPRPRLFRYAFSQSGRLLPYYENYFNRLTRIMLRRGQIQPSDTIGLTDSVYLAGPAAKWFENYDPYLADSLIVTLEPIFK